MKALAAHCSGFGAHDQASCGVIILVHRNSVMSEHAKWNHRDTLSDNKTFTLHSWSFPHTYTSSKAKHTSHITADPTLGSHSTYDTQDCHGQAAGPGAVQPNIDSKPANLESIHEIHLVVVLSKFAFDEEALSLWSLEDSLSCGCSFYSVNSPFAIVSRKTAPCKTDQNQTLKPRTLRNAQMPKNIQKQTWVLMSVPRLMGVIRKFRMALWKASVANKEINCWSRPNNTNKTAISA